MMTANLDMRGEIIWSCGVFARAHAGCFGGVTCLSITLLTLSGRIQDLHSLPREDNLHNTLNTDHGTILPLTVHFQFEVDILLQD